MNAVGTQPRTGRMTPLAAIAAGALAGAAGTAAMDTVRYLRYRRAGGTDRPLAWEFPRVDGWEDAPDPGQVARRLLEGFTQRQVPDRWARLMSTAAHWSYGCGLGALYGVAAGSLPDPRPVYGLAFGAGVCVSGYLFLAIGGLYEPIWRYDARTLAKDVSAHLVYGTTTAVLFRLADRAGALAHRPCCD